jgi:hypothetical protein
MAKITLPILEELTRKLFHEENKRELKSLNKDDEALFVKFKKFCQNFKKEGKFVHLKSPIEKESLKIATTARNLDIGPKIA